MERARDELDPSRHGETELIFRDAYNVSRNLPELHTGQGHKDYKLSSTGFLRVRVFHPDRPESISGADVFYERHDSRAECANVVAVQYKIWEDQSLPLSDQRMQGQLTRMRSFLCNQQICQAGATDHTFRFPYCSAFLRPTDKLQNPTQKLKSSGEHLPICRIADAESTGPRGGRVLTYDNIRNMSLSHDVFESLFTTGKIGSRTLTYPELREIYGRLQIPDQDRLLIHAQDFEQPDDTLFD